jgi:hypothetical protein
MGRNVPAMVISRQDRRTYREKVRTCLDVLERMLSDSVFESGSHRVGLEIEFNLVDDHGRAARSNEAVLEAIGNPAWATELGQFNLEFNGAPVVLAKDAFTRLETSLGEEFAHAFKQAEGIGCRMLMVGILPSLRQADIGEDVISSNPRFRLLNDQIMTARGEEMRICIDGAEPLLAHVDNILPEAACTSVQCHLQVSADAFPSYWNAAQAVAGIEVAVAANSPFVLGHELWRETRIALFKQATDTRSEELRRQGVRPRVWFGEQWIASVSELFEENLRYFPALLPLCEDADPLAEYERGGAPALAELTLHNGTVYRWNRPVYGIAGDVPHLRVENRVLPAGPTLTDVLANAAFYYGLVHELAVANPVWSRMSFAAAESNLAAAARHGLDAEIYWPGFGVVGVCELILRHLLPLAASGLGRFGVDAADAGRLLGIIEQRCLTGLNGAAWQVRSVRGLEERGVADRAEALRLMTQEYIERMNSGEPVHTWPDV